MSAGATPDEPDSRAAADSDTGRTGASGETLPGDEPDIGKTREAIRTVEYRSLGLTLLAVLGGLYTLYFARGFLLPLVFAILLSFLLSPLIRWLEKLRIPAAFGAGLVIVVFLGGVGTAAYGLSEPAAEWLDRAPRMFSQIGGKLSSVRAAGEQVTRTAEQVEDATDMADEDGVTEVVVKGPSLVSRLFGTTQNLLAAVLEVIVVLYFLLAAGDLFLQKLINVLPQLKDKKKAVRIVRETEDSISTYLTTVALMNVGEGIAVAGVLWALGMPSPFLWGALAALFECVPYVGAAAMFAILTLAGLTLFDGIGHALLIPGSFLAINLIQGNVIAPMVLGHRLTLNPVAIVIGVAFWWWIWGLPGAFIAVPLLATFKILCDHIETLAPIGEFLGK